MLGLRDGSKFRSASESPRFGAGRLRSGRARKRRRTDLAAQTDRPVTVGRIILGDLALVVRRDPVDLAGSVVRRDLVAQRDLAAPAVMRGLEARADRAIPVVAVVLIVVGAGGNPHAPSDLRQRLTVFIPPSA